MRMMKDFSSEYPYQVYLTDEVSSQVISQIDEWCQTQWGMWNENWDYINKGWRFKQESDALEFMMTWS